MGGLFHLLFLVSTVALANGQFRSPEITEHPADLLVPRNEPATLNCHAEGKPKPTITWFKDGKPFRLNKEGARHVLLDNGDLFFLRVLQTKKDQDTGIYWCQAANSVGTVRSKNASLEISVLKEEFQVTPEDARVAEGETALLRCIPPKGHPEPVVVWTKDASEIDPASQHRFKIVDKGSLVITGVRVSDSGKYACKARNVYASRQTPPATLSVLVPPHLVTSSQQAKGNSGSTVELVCRVGGDPPPEVYWERAPPGELPIERMVQEENGQVLRIRHATADDQGIYICRAENPVGSVKANISLSIYSRPVISVNPVEARVGINGSVSFECKASGNPIPTTYWTHEGTGVVVGTGQTWGEGRVFVDSHNTLTIRSITKDDEGFYVCSAVGVAGSALARAQLEVQSVTDMPPPLIALGAPNQTLPVNTEGEMPCEASGTPEPKVVWYVGEKPFKRSDRASVTPFGTLRIEKLKMSDTGVYTCKAVSEAGTTEWATSLTVANPANPNVAFFKMPSDRALPEPPGLVTIQAVNTTSVTLGWRRSRPGSSPVLGFILQQWSPDLRGPWTTSITRPASLSTLPVGAVVTDLLPDTRYVFVVRASNSHGLSRPSDITPIVHTLATDKHHTLSLQEIRARIAVPSVKLLDEVSVTATSIRIKWSLLVDASIIEGIYVRYRGIEPTERPNSLSVETVYFHKTDSAPPEDYLITGLHPSTKYEVFITPFYENVEGQPSAAIRSRTLESQPDAAPESVTQEFLNATTIVLHWKAIPDHLANGIIQNYLIQVIGPSDSQKIVKTVPGDIETATVTGLTPGISYQASVRGLTGSGPGPASVPLPFRYIVEGKPNPSVSYGSDLPSVTVDTNQYLVIGIAVASVFLFLFLFGVVMYIFRQRRKKKSSSFFGKGSAKDTWCEYTDSWNESCKSMTNTGSASSNHIQTKSNSVPHGFPTSTSQQFCNNESFDNANPYQIRPTEDLYEDPDGLRLVSFTKYSAKRCFSPEPYATTPLITDNYLKGTIQPSRQTMDAINCSTISPPDLCPPDNRFINFNAPLNKGDLLGGPVLQFPPPPSVPADQSYGDNCVQYAGKNKNSFTRFLQQQLPYSMTGGSSSGGSQKSHGSPIGPRPQRNGRMPNSNHYHETRLLQPQDLPALVEGNQYSRKPMETECYSQPMNIIPDSTNSSVLGDGEESDSYSYSSGCSSNPALAQSHEQNFVESLRATGDPRWRDPGEFTTSPSGNSFSQKRPHPSSAKDRKPYAHIPGHVTYESVTSPLV